MSYKIYVYKEIKDLGYGVTPLDWHLAGEFTKLIDAEAQKQRLIDDGYSDENIRIVEPDLPPSINN
jgi:hypothetical protein